MKKLILINFACTIFFLFVSCNNHEKSKSKEVSIDSNEKSNSKNYIAKEIEQIKIGESINGDFDGDGITETARIIITEKGVFDEKPWKFSVNFTNNKIKSLLFTCDKDYSTLINEGDLNITQGDEITIYSPPNHGCTFWMETFTLKNGVWKQVIEPFIVPTFCDELSNNDLQDRIFLNGDTIYYYSNDLNDEKMKLIKTKATLID